MNENNQTKTTNSPAQPKRKPKRRLFLKIFLFLLLALGLFSAYFFMTLPDVEFLEKQNPKTSRLMEIRIAEAKEKGKTLKIYHRWVNFNSIPKLLKYAVRISEDDSFYEHDGIDYKAMKEAYQRNTKTGHKTRGGSTITQQLAKNLFLTPQKSYYRKLREFFIAKKLESHLSKDRIFCIYLNIIEFGPGVFGVGAASQYFFKKPVSQLNLEQILRLVSVIPKPLRVSPLSNSRYIKWRAKLILDRMKRYGYISDDDYHSTRKAFQ